MLEQMYRQLVMEHAKNRKNHTELTGDQVMKVHYKNPTCGDAMTLFLKMNAADQIDDIAFQGYGCSISMASSSMMTELIKSLKLDEVSVLRSNMENLIRKGETPRDCDLEDALSLRGVHKLPARHNCALMPWQALDKALKDNDYYQGIRDR
jgi:nitrogen fixation protein NifU and related proteins